MLRNQGYDAHAVAFGPPSCVSPDGEWLHKELRRHVTSIVVDSDIVPRLTNHSISRLLSPKPHALGAITNLFQGGLSSLMNPQSAEPLLSMFGVGRDKEADDGNHNYPPGRLYVLERAKGRDWSVREVVPGEFSDILLTHNMLVDHRIETYQQAVQQASIRHMQQCKKPGIFEGMWGKRGEL